MTEMDTVPVVAQIAMVVGVCMMAVYVAARAAMPEKRGYQPRRPEGPEVDLLAHPPESDESAIQPAPLKVAFTVPVRYVHVGKMGSVPYDWDGPKNPQPEEKLEGR
jgi:hypothetical protein